jgi:hypothetical protein
VGEDEGGIGEGEEGDTFRPFWFLNQAVGGNHHYWEKGHCPKFS